MNPALDLLYHSGQLGVFLVVAWYVIKRVNRDESLKKDFPPHAHLPGGYIKYPEEYPAPKLGNLEGAD